MKPVRWMLAWVPLVFLMILNGVIRESLYGPSLGELSAHQLSTVTGAVIYLAYVWAVFGKLGLEGPGTAWKLGLFWLSLTVAFEFGFGHYVVGHPWGRLFGDYNLLAGRVWLLFLVWVLVAPALVFRMKDGA
jgi:hypothetical protein